MRVLFALIGLVLIALTMADFVWTTPSVKGAGPMTARLAGGLWAGLRRISRAAGAPPALILGGPAILVGSLACWVALLWLGWLLVFLADPESIVTSPGGEPTDLWGRIYFIGFTISTLGVGDLKPNGALWRVMTPLAALNGLVVITVAITYLVSVLSAVIAMRQLAAYITALGDTPEGFVVTGWDGRSFASLGDHLSSMTPSLLQNSQGRLAYPILHYFHPGRAEIAIDPATAILDEALLLLQHGVAPDHRPPPAMIRPLRNALNDLLDNLSVRFAWEAPEAPPPPSLAPLREAGIPTVGDAAFAAAVAERRDRRRLLAAMVRDEGWAWPGRRQASGDQRNTGAI